jgi:hypothetical protein
LGGGEKLREDLERPTGRGDKAHPQTLEQALTLLTPQLGRTREAAAATPPELRGSRFVIEAKVLPNYLAATYFPAKLFRVAKLDLLGVRVGRGEYRTKKSAGEERETKSYLLSAGEESFEELQRVFRGEIGKRAFEREARESLRFFDMIRFPGPEQTLRGERQPAGAELTWEAVFHPALDRGTASFPEREEIWAKWLALVKRLGGRVAVEHRHEVSDLLFVPVRLSAHAAEEAAAFNPLRALRPMPTLEPAPVVEIRDLDHSGPAPPQASEPRSNLRVAVFDGGVDLGAPQLAPFVKSTDLTDEPPVVRDVKHGTMVTASVLYGADHGDSGTLSQPEVGVDHYRVLPPPPDPTFDLDVVSVLEQIERKVVDEGYKIVNLSIGPQVALEDDAEPHAWTARLDALAERHGVLFCTAVGNDGAADPSSGAHRIQVPSDMVNGIGIGACDGRRGQVSWTRAPYSSLGPGRPGARMQPTGVAFGGVAARPFRGIGPGGRVLSTAGTSFATPVVVHGLSALAAQLRPQDWDASVLRAFAAHYAEAPNGDDPLHDEVGFGRLLERYDEAFECEPNEAVILYRDEIERGQLISLGLPLPGGAIQGHKLTIDWSIAFCSPTDPKNPVDYTQASLEAHLRPHYRTHSFSKKGAKPETINLDEREDRAIELLAQGYTQSSLPVTDDYHPMLPESVRRGHGKWETLMRATKTKRAVNFRKPQITLLHLARRQSDLAYGTPPLQFAMLVTLRAAPGVPLYDEIRREYPILTPIRTQIPVRVTL